MNRKFRFLAILMMLLAAFVFTGCDGNAVDGLFDSDNGGDGPTPPPAPTPTTVAVESVSLDKATMVLKTRTDGTLTATVLPENATDKSVTWSSDKPEVATVDQNGKVSGEAAGTATITVTTTDGAKTAFCEVTVADEVYTVSFNMNGHGTQLDNQTVAKDGKISEPTAPTADGVNFKGWYKEEGCTTAWNFDTDIVSVDNTILYAKWVYEVSFVANGGSGSMDPVEKNVGDGYTAPANGFTAPAFAAKAGAVDAKFKNFAGWNTVADGSGTAYAVNDEIPKANVTLYAQWANPVFTVGVDSEGTAKKVYFAKGNLYWDGSSSFKLEEKQYNTTPTSSGLWDTSHVSHFYWSKTAKSAYAQNYDSSGNLSDVFFTNKTETEPNDDFTVDNITGTYRVLASGEWTWLLGPSSDANPGTNCRKSSTIGRTENARYAKVKVDSKAGILLFPDVFEWTVDMGTAPDNCNTANTAWTDVKGYTTDQFKEMENRGVVFLPAAGYRNDDFGGDGVNGVGSDGYYWSSTPHASNKYYAYYLYFYDSDVGPASSDSRYWGSSVRLVCADEN